MGFKSGLTSDVPAFLLLGKALALADVVEQVEVVADGDVVEQVEEEVHVLRALGQNLLLGGCFIILNIIVCHNFHFGGPVLQIQREFLLT